MSKLSSGCAEKMEWVRTDRPTASKNFRTQETFGKDTYIKAACRFQVRRAVWRFTAGYAAAATAPTHRYDPSATLCCKSVVLLLVQANRILLKRRMEIVTGR